MNQALNEFKFGLSPELEVRELPDGTRLWKQTARLEYLALTPEQAKILHRFNGVLTVQEILRQLLPESPRPSIREFYELIEEAREAGFLTLAGEPAGEPAPVLRPARWPVGWGLGPALLAAIVFIPSGIMSVYYAETLVPQTLPGWLETVLWVVVIISLAHLLAGCVVAGFGRTVYRPRLALSRGFPYFTVDLRDAFMAGRSCQAAVALQMLAVPFLLASVGALVISAPLLLAALAVMLIYTSPFGRTPIHELLHALLRKTYQLPHCAGTFLSRKVFSSLFRAKAATKNEEYYLVYTLYAVGWIGLVVTLAAKALAEPANFPLEDLWLAPDPVTRISAVLVVSLMALLILLPLTGQLWFLLRNLYAVIAAHWLTAEGRFRDRRAAGERPAAEELVRFLKNTLLFASLSETELTELAAAMRFVLAKPGETVLRIGDAGDNLFVVYSGRVVVFKENEAGDLKKVVELGAGEVFGEIALLDNDSRTATVTILEPARLLVLAKADFDRLLLRSLGADRIREIIQIVSFLRRNPLFADWPDPALKAFAPNFSFAEFAGGAVVIREQQINNAFYLVYEGEFEVRRQGRRQAILGAGDFFGEISLFKNVETVAEVLAAGPGRCLKLDREKFLHLLTQDPLTGVAIESAVEARLRGSGT